MNTSDSCQTAIDESLKHLRQIKKLCGSLADKNLKKSKKDKLSEPSQTEEELLQPL